MMISTLPIDVVDSSAIISPCGKYRYVLSRQWDDRPIVTFVMLNPSTADAQTDDPTIRKCMGFARRWAMGGIRVVNLFAFRATNPKEMLASNDPVGPDNHTHITRACYQAFHNGGKVICAWGIHGSYLDQDKTFMGWMDMADIDAMALQVTKKGAPWHPLYVPYACVPIAYQGRM